MLRATLIVCLVVTFSGCAGREDSDALEADAFSQSLFANPPVEFGPQTRWWWPGGAVDDATGMGTNAAHLGDGKGRPSARSGKLPIQITGTPALAVETLVESLRSVVLVAPSVADIPAVIANAGVTPPLSPIDSAGLQLSVQHRQVTNGHVYFLFNESYEPRTEQVRIEGAFTEARVLDPDTGDSVAADLEGDVVTVTLPAARGTVLWLRHAP